jgi:hypothetical protein
MSKMYAIEIPGSYASDVAYLDLETVKVELPGGFRMRNGETLRRRWSVALAGIAAGNDIFLFDAVGDESYALYAISDALAPFGTVVYGATREFDEMICKGKFTNARRAHETVVFYPAVPDADEIEWRNVGVGKSGAYRAADVPSRDVPKAIAKGELEIVLIHLLRDVADLILEAGSPDAVCAAWCGAVLASNDFALGLIRTA